MSDRFSRQNNFVPKRMFNSKIIILGCGAVGRNIALTLAPMGFNNFYLYDFDTIEDHNCASQGWNMSDIGKKKTTALKKEMTKLNENMSIKCFDKWAPDYEFYDFIFLAADCMMVRESAFRYYTARIGKKPLIIDTRMRGEEMRIVSSWNIETRNYHAEQFFRNEDAADGSCTSQTTLYASKIISSLAIQKMLAFKTKKLLHKDSLWNLAASLKVEY